MSLSIAKIVDIRLWARQPLSTLIIAVREAVALVAVVSVVVVAASVAVALEAAVSAAVVRVRASNR